MIVQYVDVTLPSGTAEVCSRGAFVRWHPFSKMDQHCFEELDGGSMNLGEWYTVEGL